MKKFISSAALLLVVSTGLFAATPAKNDPTEDQISVETSTKAMVVGLNIQKETAGKAYVTFFDAEKKEIMTDYLSSKNSTEKAYNISQLAPGNYTMTVTSNKQTVVKQLNVYVEYGKKAYVFLQ